YMSPEHFDARTVTPASDIYSAGLVFFELLTGKPPYPSGDLYLLIGQKMLGPPPDVRKMRPAVPETLARIIMKMLEPEASDRYDSVQAVLADLQPLHDETLRCLAGPGSTLKSGQVLEGRYRVESVLGRGGMGGVYRGTHLQLEIPVAIKQLEIGIHDDELRASAERQFRQEARILCSLHHAQLPRVYDLLELDGSQYIVMDFIDGKSLDTVLLTTGPQPVAQVLEWARGLCDVLEYLHEQQPPVIFRDLKPSNIMVDTAGGVRLIDFGIAKKYDMQRTGTIAHESASTGFAAPEQYGGTTDVRSDTYALGATLYALLSGLTPPHAVERAAGVADLEPFEANSNPAITEAVRWMMAIHPADRPQTVRQARVALFGTSAVVPTQMTRRVAGHSIEALPGPKSLPSTRSLAVALGGLAGLVIIVLSGLMIRNVLLPPTQAPPVPATLRITSSPAACDVYLQGSLQGKTPLVLNHLEPQTYALRVQHDGYETLRRAITLEGAEQRVLQLKLQLVASPTPLVAATNRPSPRPARVGPKTVPLHPAPRRPSPHPVAIAVTPTPLASVTLIPGMTPTPGNLTISTPTVPVAAADLIVPGSSIGPVAIGLTLQEVTARAGFTPKPAQASRYSLDGGRIRFKLADSQQVDEIFAYGGELRLPTGLGVGSTRSRVEQVYGTATEQGAVMAIEPDGERTPRTDVFYRSLGLGFRYYEDRVMFVAIVQPNASMTWKHWTRF
ncbi:MAG: serine/threonine protein kinase, partial [Candidatus Xenobia bacterium]